MQAYAALALAAYLVFVIGGVMAQHSQKSTVPPFRLAETIGVAVSIVLLPAIVLNFFAGSQDLIDPLLILAIVAGALTFFLSLFIPGPGRWAIALASIFYTFNLGAVFFFWYAFTHSTAPLKMW